MGLGSFIRRSDLQRRAVLTLTTIVIFSRSSRALDFGGFLCFMLLEDAGRFMFKDASEVGVRIPVGGRDASDDTDGLEDDIEGRAEHNPSREKVQRTIASRKGSSRNQEACQRLLIMPCRLVMFVGR